jgi:DsbC/DsbD-like thiol-disulfide interchange protein
MLMPVTRAFVVICCLTLASCGNRSSHSTPTGNVATKASEGPVTAAITVDSEAIAAGGQFTASVEVQIAQGWHIYAVDLPTGVASPTSLQWELPAAVEQAGEWIVPAASPTAAGGQVALVFEKTVSFQCPLRVAADAAPGETTIRCRLLYQACDRFTCRPPVETTLTTSVRIVP